MKPQSRTPQSGASLRAATLCATFALASAPAVAQDGRPVAFVNARIITMAGDPIEKGTLLLRNGAIAGVGKDVEIPAGTKVIDAAGKTLMPGLVSAWSQAGLESARGRNIQTRGGFRGMRPSRGRSSGGGRTANSAASKVVDQLYARQDVFGELLEVGVTTLALAPQGNGFPGTAAILRPDGTDRESMIADDSAFLVIGMNRDSGTKKLLKESFEKAQEAVKERTKPKAEEKADPKAKEAAGDKKEAAKPSGKPDDPKPDTPKPDKPKPDEPKPEPKPDPKPDGGKPKPDAKSAPAKQQPKPRAKPKDPNVEALADMLQKKQRGFLLLNSAADIMHYRDAVGDDLNYPTTIVATRIDGNSGHFDQAMEPLKELLSKEAGGAVLMPPSMSTVPRTSYFKHPAAELHAAGISVGFIIGDNKGTVRGLFFRLMEMVRYGMPRDAALAAVTSVPAKALGLGKSVGTLEKGKRANVLVFDGDPLDPLGQLSSVWIEGRLVNSDS